MELQEYTDQGVKLAGNIRANLWKLGDLANALAAEHGVVALRDWASEIGVPGDNPNSAIFRYMKVAKAYPTKANRSPINSWGVHSLFAHLPKCIELVNSKRWTYREAMQETSNRKDIKAASKVVAREAARENRGFMAMGVDPQSEEAESLRQVRRDQREQQARQREEQRQERLRQQQAQQLRREQQRVQRKLVELGEQPEPESDSDNNEEPEQQRHRVENNLQERWSRPAPRPQDHRVYGDLRRALFTVEAVPKDKDAIQALVQTVEGIKLVRDLNSAIRELDKVAKTEIKAASEVQVKSA